VDTLDHSSATTLSKEDLSDDDLEETSSTANETETSSEKEEANPQPINKTIASAVLAPCIFCDNYGRKRNHPVIKNAAMCMYGCSRNHLDDSFFVLKAGLIIFVSTVHYLRSQEMCCMWNCLQQVFTWQRVLQRSFLLLCLCGQNVQQTMV